MLDIQFIRDNPAHVVEKAHQKGVEVDVDQLLGFDAERRVLLQQVERLRQRRNEVADSMKGQRPHEEQVAAGRELKRQLADLEHRLTAIDESFMALLKQVPNMPSDDTPVGTSEDDNQVLYQWGDKPEFDFVPKPHWEMTDYIEEPRATAISGARFAYLQKGIVRLQFALNSFAMDQLTDEKVIQQIVTKNGLEASTKPFQLMMPPMMMRTQPYAATARLKPDEITFKLAHDDLWLIGSAEHSMAAYYMNDIIEADDLPVRFLGHSTSFRREVGSAGKDTRGIFRTHHFDKLEMESFTGPETSEVEHKLFIAIQEHLMQALGLPYQVVLKCTFDMGSPNARGVDIETWMPGQGLYRETHSADLLTDYQARRLKTRVRTPAGERVVAHTNDATAVTTRVLIAIMENYQLADGRIRIPRVLQPYMGGGEHIA